MSVGRVAGAVACVLVLVGCSDEAGDSATPTTAAAGAGASAQAGGLFAQIPDLVATVEPSVVAILTDSGQGSGVIWAGDGVVVTNNHVVAGARQVQVAFADGRRSPAQLAGTDPQTDPSAGLGITA